MRQIDSVIYWGAGLLAYGLNDAGGKAGKFRSGFSSLQGRIEHFAENRLDL